MHGNDESSLHWRRLCHRLQAAAWELEEPLSEVLVMQQVETVLVFSRALFVDCGSQEETLTSLSIGYEKGVSKRESLVRETILIQSKEIFWKSSVVWIIKKTEMKTVFLIRKTFRRRRKFFQRFKIPEFTVKVYVTHLGFFV